MPRYQATPVERAQPWLGTLVTVRACGPDKAAVHHAIDQAFAELRTVHQVMSFHSAQSDVSALNRSAFERPIPVHPFTREVLTRALEFSAESDGCFDVSIGTELVASGMLPKPPTNCHTHGGNWRDITILPDGRVAFGRPLWIDLGGIAKGYAVDRAVACLRENGIPQAVVNAGGDLRVYGPQSELIALRVDAASHCDGAALEISDGSAASSSGYKRRRPISGKWSGPHFDGVNRMPAPTDRFACVLASECLVADALTKVVLARGAGSRTLLCASGASAHLYDPGSGWIHLNEEQHISESGPA